MRQVFGVILNGPSLTYDQGEELAECIEAILKDVQDHGGGVQCGMDPEPDLDLKVEVYYSGQVENDAYLVANQMGDVTIVNAADPSERCTLHTPRREMDEEFAKKVFRETFRRGLDKDEDFTTERLAPDQYRLTNNRRDEHWVITLDDKPPVIE